MLINTAACACRCCLRCSRTWRLNMLQALVWGGETLDRGFLWIVTKIKLEIIRLPVYGEDIILKTWPGETSRVYFPRYYELRSSSDELLARASSLWALIEGEKRSPVIPGAESIHVKGHISGNELLLPTGLRIPDNEACKTDSALRTVLYSDIDMNGHMNNTQNILIG